MAPTSRLEKPSTRVYSSPNPTQPDSSTMGEDSARPQKSTRSGEESSFAAAFMGRALYDARPMQTQVICLLALMGASTLAAAQAPVAQPANPALSAPVFNGSDAIPNPKGFADAYSLDEVRIGGAAIDEAQQV